MWSLPKLIAIAVSAAVVVCATGAALAETGGRDAGAVLRAEETVERLRAELARVNAEVAQLKRADRSIRSDYRLRERMADAEALAQKLTRAEANLRALGGERNVTPGGAPVVASPLASPQDGSVELEAKADLLVDQARKLEGEASVLAKAADQLRSRKALRRKAGSWERDPFAGLETSKRNVAAAASAIQKTAGTTTGAGAGADSTRGGATPGSTPPTLSLDGSGTVGAMAPVAAPAPTVTGSTESTSKTAVSSAASDGTAAAKSSPLAQPGSADRQAIEQRLYLDPTTAAQLRQALGTRGGALDPEALERGAAALRARARVLATQAQALRAQSRTP